MIKDVFLQMGSCYTLAKFEAQNTTLKGLVDLHNIVICTQCILCFWQGQVHLHKLHWRCRSVPSKCGVFEREHSMVAVHMPE